MKKLMLSLMTLVLTAFGVFAGEPLVYGPFGTDDDVVIDKVEPTIFPGVSLTFGEAAAAVDDCVAVYRKSSDQLCGLGKVIVYRGQPQLTLSMQVNGGTEVYVKGWQKASGVVTDLVASLDGGAFAETVAMPESGSVDSVLALKTVEVPPPPASPIREEDVVIDKVEPTIFAGVSLTFGETPMAAGDVVGIYRKSTGVLCGYGEAIVHQGEVLMTLSCQVKEGTEVSFRGWQKATGTLTNLVASLDGGAFAETVAMPESGSVDSVLVLKTGEADPPVPPEPTVYAIAYDLAGGANVAGNPASYTTNDLPIMLAAPTREGYEFAGWTPAGEIAAGTTGDLTFTATWTEIPVPPASPIREEDVVIDKVEPTIFAGVSLTFGETPMAVGDVVGMYRKSTGVLCGYGEAIVHQGEVLMTLSCQVKEGTEVSFKGWQKATGTLTNLVASLDGGAFVETVAMPESGSVDSVLVLKTVEVPPPSASPIREEDVVFDKVEPTIFPGVSLTFGETPMAAGDVVGIYRKSTGVLCGYGEAIVHQGEVLMTLSCQVKEGTEVSFRGWQKATGTLTNLVASLDGGAFAETVAMPESGSVDSVLVLKTGEADPPVPPEPPATYAIAYDLAGGVNAAGNPASYTTNDLPIALAAPTREGYEFAGWTPFGEIPAGTTGDLKITATWKEVPVPPAVSLVVPFEDGEELAKGEQIDGADHLIVVNDVVEPKITVKGLPSGLKFDAKSSWIAGKPSKSGVYTLTVTVTDMKNKGMQPLVETRRLIVRGDGEHVVVASCDAAKGTVKGQGVYASGKKVTLKATAGKGYAFAGWYEGEEYVSGLASYAFTMSGDDRSYQAMFVTVDEDRAAISAHIDALGVDFAADVKRAETSVFAGVYLEWPVAVEALSDATVKVSGLPSGLKFAAKDIMEKGSKTEIAIPANTIYGTPKAASKPGKPSLVKVTVTTAGKTKQEFVLELTVNALPTWAVGTFNGGSAFGQVALTVGKDGKMSGKYLDNENTWKLSATGFEGYLEESDESGEVLYAVVQAKVGRDVEEILVLVMPEGVAGYIGGAFDEFLFEAYAADWKSGDLKATGAKIAKSPEIYGSLDGDQPGMVVFKFGANGTVKVSGQFLTGEKNGKPVYAKVSGSAVLCPMGEADGYQIFRLFVCLPAKGAFDGYAEMFDIPWDGAKFVVDAE